MAAPAFGSAGTQISGIDSTPNIDVPDSVASGDIIVVTLYIDDGATVTGMPSGFAHAPDSPVAVSAGDPSRNHSQAIMWKRATGADSTASTYDFTLSSAVYSSGQAIRYTGAVASGSPWDVTAFAVGTTAGTAWPAVSDTTTVADVLLIASSTNWSGGAWTEPAGFTERRDSGDRVITVVDKAQAVAGATGSISGSCAGSDARTSWLGALKSTAGGTDATVSASNVAGTATVGVATVKTGSTVSAAVVAGTAAVGSPTVKTGSTVTATTVAGAASVGTATVSTGSTVTTTTVAGTATVPAPTVSANTNATVAASTVAGSATVGSPSVRVGATVVPATVAGTASVGTAIVFDPDAVVVTGKLRTHTARSGVDTYQSRSGLAVSQRRSHLTTTT